MSFAHDWPLTVWPTRAEVEQAIAAVVETARIVKPFVWHMPWDDDQDDDDEDDSDEPNGFPPGDPNQTLAPRVWITLSFRVPVATAVDVAMRLNPESPRSLYDDLEIPYDHDDIPRDEYELEVELVAPEEDEDQQACIRVSNELDDNRNAFSIAVAISDALAKRLEKLSAFS
jgi:hypothetical protein